MQLKLLPPHPLPTVLFTLAYPAPPPALPLPASYAALLKRVVEDALLDAEHNILARVDGPLPLSHHLSSSHLSSSHSPDSPYSDQSDHPHNGVSPALRSLGSPTAPHGQGVNGGQGSLTPHALDRATWLAAVLAEVVFDLSDGTAGSAPGSPISPDPLAAPASPAATNPPGADAPGDAAPRRVRVLCRYVDGREVSWVWEAPAEGEEEKEGGGEAAACYAALQRVLRDVTESAAAGERERAARERRHGYAERFAFVEGERYDRYPVPAKDVVMEGREVRDGEEKGDGQEEKKGRKRHSLPLAPMQRSSSCEDVRARAAPGRRRSLEELGRAAGAHVPGAVETRRGKGKKGRRDEGRREDRQEEEDGKKKHKKRGSFMMGLVALASLISPRSTRARSPPRPPSPSPESAPAARSAPASRSPSPSPPHVVHPQLALAPHADPPLSSSDLRRRARATLVDVFRRHVLAQLKTPHARPPRAPRRVRSAASLADPLADFAGEDYVAGGGERMLRSVGSALTSRSSDASLSGASTRVHCVSRSPSAGGLRGDVLRGADAHALHARLAAGHATHDDSDDDDDVHPFGRANEGGYVTWVARSLLTRVDAEMRAMRVVLRALHARPARPASGARVGFSPVDGPLLAPLSVSPPVAGCAGVVGEWGAATLVDEPAPFFEGFDEEGLEEVSLDEEEGGGEDDAEDRTSTGASSSSGSTETDGSSVHTPSEATSFDGACIRAPATPPLAEPERGEYFGGVQDQSAEFDALPLASSPPRRPVLTKQPPIHAVKETHPPPLPSQQDQPPAYRPVLSPISTGSVPRSLTPSTSSALSSPDLSQSSPSPSTLPIAAYTALSGERARLLGILARLATQHAAAQADERQLLTVLEAKSRRRAWSNRAFMGGASVRLCALALPDRRSPLATATVISPAELAAAAAPELEGVGGVKKKRGSLVVTTAESNILRLFPVCEEDEDSGSDDDGAGDRSFRAGTFRAGAFATASFPGAAPDAALAGRAEPRGAQPAHARPAAAHAAARARAAPPQEEPAREDAALGPLDPAAASGRRPADAELVFESSAADDFPDIVTDTYTTMGTPLVRHRRTSVPVRTRTRTRSMSGGGAAASTSTSADEAPFMSAPRPLGLAPALPILPPLSASYPGAHAPLPPLLGPGANVPYMLPGTRRASTADLLAEGADEDAGWSAALEPQTKVELFDVYSGDEDDEDEDGGARMDEVDDEFLLGVDIAGPAELPSFCRPRVGAEGWMPAAHL